MATSYPGGYDSLPRVDGRTMDEAGYSGPEVVDNLSDAVEAIQATLGLNPAGSYSTVLARLLALEERVIGVEGPTLPLYGSAYAADALQNLRVGYLDASLYQVSQRFRADRTGNIESIRTWLKNMGTVTPGYGLGDGGTIQITVQTDDNGIPSGTQVGTGTATAYPGAADGGGVNPGRFSDWTFDSVVPIVEGDVYHIVYVNVAAAPDEDYCSVNGTYQYSSPTALPTPVQPRWPDDSFATLSKHTGSWAVFPGTTPIMDLTFDDASHFGSAYMDLEYTNCPDITSTTHMVRESITPSENWTVSSVGVRIARTSGTGDLLVRLEDSGGTLIDSCSISTSAVPVLTKTANASAGIWVTGVFGSSQTLSSGTTYRLRLSTDSSTVLWTRGIQSGEGYGFDASTCFADGVMEYTTNSGSTWAQVTGLAQYGDVQFYLKP